MHVIVHVVQYPYHGGSWAHSREGTAVSRGSRQTHPFQQTASILGRANGPESATAVAMGWNTIDCVGSPTVEEEEKEEEEEAEEEEEKE